MSADWWRGAVSGALVTGWLILVIQFIVKNALP